jgi:urease accessory protein
MSGQGLSWFLQSIARVGSLLCWGGKEQILRCAKDDMSFRAKRSGARNLLLVALAVPFATILFPLRVEAHLNSTGLGPVYDGLAHFLLSPEDLVPVLALALFAGLRGAAYGRRALFVLPGAWLLGGLIGMAAPTNRGTALTAISFLILGGLLAADARLSLRATAALAALVGLCHGYLNGAGMGQPGVGAVALLGLVFAVFVLVALAAALVVRLRWPWTRIAVRVFGSWIAASGLLMVGWAVRRG